MNRNTWTGMLYFPLMDLPSSTSVSTICWNGINRFFLAFTSALNCVARPPWGQKTFSSWPKSRSHKLNYSRVAQKYQEGWSDKFMAFVQKWLWCYKQMKTKRNVVWPMRPDMTTVWMKEHSVPFCDFHQCDATKICAKGKALRIRKLFKGEVGLLHTQKD